jgi:proteasome lid subunit RPN8/RPN11
MAAIPKRIKLLQDESVSAGPVRAEVPVSLQGLTDHRSENEVHHEGDCIVVFPQSAYRCVVEHLSADVTREHGGFLLGYETWSEEAHAPVVVVEHAIPASHTSGTPVRLKFTKESWRELDAITEKLSKNGHAVTRVGWYHSHPDLNIFLSHWDLDVCKEFDRRQNPIALVVDPVKRRGGFFVRGKDGYQPQQAQGFLERHDLQESSIVDWINLKHEAVKPIPISGPEIKAIDLESAKLERQISEIAALLRQTTSANRRLSLITILLAILLSGGTWYAVNRRIDSVSTDVEQISKKLDRAVDNFGKAIVEMEDKTAGQNQSDASGSVQKAESQPENPDSKPKSVSKNGSEKSKPGARATDQSADHGGKQKSNPKDLKAKDAKSPAQPGSGAGKGTTTAQKSSASPSIPDGGQPGKSASATEGTTKQGDGTASQPGTDDKGTAKNNNSAGDAKTGNEPKSGDSEVKPSDTKPKEEDKTPGQDPPPGIR